jgi:hypothetical protein
MCFHARPLSKSIERVWRIFGPVAVKLLMRSGLGIHASIDRMSGNMGARPLGGLHDERPAK